MDKMSTLESVFRGASGAEPRVFSEKGAATQGYWEDLGERSVESATATVTVPGAPASWGSDPWRQLSGEIMAGRKETMDPALSPFP